MGMPQARAGKQCEEGVTERSCYGVTAGPIPLHSLGEVVERSGVKSKVQPGKV